MRARAALLLSALAAACGGDAGPAPVPRHAGELDARLELSADPPRPRQAEVVEEWAFPADAGAWTVRAPLVEERRPEDGPADLAIATNDRRAIDVERRGAFDTGDFDEVHVLASFVGKGELRVAVLDGDRLLGEGAPVALVEAPDPRPTVLRLPLELADLGAFDRLAVRMTGSKRYLGLTRIALVRTEPEARLPAADAPDLVRIAGESRRAAGLSARTSLVARTHVDGPARLTFSYGVPATATLPGQETRLRLVAEVGDETVERTWSVEPVWRSAAVDLPGDGQRPATLRFTSEGAEGEVSLVALGEVSLARPAQVPASVLLVTTDTHRGDHLGAVAPGLLDTPALDALAARGVLFEECFSSTNYTNPSHVALMTGTHPRDTGIVTNRQRLNASPTTLAEVFRGAGYLTWAALSARHLRDDVSGLGQGFDRVSGPDEADRPSEETVARALAWLEDRGERPVFLWLHVFDAHWPYELEEPLRSRYYDPSVPAEPWPGHVRQVRGAGEVDDLNFYRAQYRGEITYLDGQLRRVLEHPAFGGAVVAVVGDHGESMGAHDQYFSHSGMFPDTLHVPLILAWPGGPTGERVPGRVRQIDLGRTLVDLTGLDGAGFGGASLLRGRAWEAGGPVFALHSSELAASLTEGTTHFILHLADHESMLGQRKPRRGDVELYDLAADPGCTVDLASERPEEAAALRARVEAWLAERAELGWRGSSGVSADVAAQLEALGYADREE